MSIRRSKDQKGSFYQYSTLTKFYYITNDQLSRTQAKKKAIKQSLNSKNGSGLSDILKEGYKRVKGFISGVRNGPSPEIRNLIKNHGDAYVKKITVCRSPIHKVLDSIINYISLGSYQKVKDKLKYDDMFHLFMFIELSDGYKFRIEKNEVVRLTSDVSNKSEQECIPIEIGNQKVKLDEMFNRAISSNPKFWLYDPVNNNCQDFILSMLQSSGLGNQEDFKFIKQDAVTLFSQLPSYVGKFGKLLTDLAGRGDRLIRGNGKKTMKK